jgi:hypothetical protein
LERTTHAAFLERWIVDCLHRSDRIDRRHFGLSIPCIAHHNVAGQHCANLVFQAENCFALNTG